MEDDMFAVKLRLEPLVHEIGYRLYVFFSFALVIVIAPVLILFYAACCLCVLAVRVKLLLSRRSDGAHVASGMDVLWTSDVPDQNYIVNGVLFLNGIAETQSFRDRLQALIQSDSDDNGGRYPFRKLRQRLCEEMGVCVWRDCDPFSIDNHVVLESVVETELDLRTTLEQLAARPFNAEQPPWQVHIFPLDPVTYPSLDGGPQFCLLFRVDHIIADGISIIYLLLKHVMDPCEGSAPSLAPPPSRPVKKQPHYIWRLLDTLYHAPSICFSLVTRAEQNSLHNTFSTSNKIIRWSRPIPLQTFREIRKATGATVNDIYLTALAGSLRRFFLTAEPLFPRRVTAILPVSLHKSVEQVTRLENNITCGLLPLATDFSDSKARLAATCRSTAALKRSPELLVNACVFRFLINVLPLWATRRIMRMSPATLVTSTVPGPSQRVSICGHKLTRILYFAPHRGNTAITACLMSYTGQMTFVLYVDAALVDSAKDVDRIVAGFNDEIERMAVSCTKRK